VVVCATAAGLVHCCHGQHVIRGVHFVVGQFTHLRSKVVPVFVGAG
jgi:hypothetical protein